MSLVFSLMNAIIVFEMTLTCILRGFYFDLCDINLALTNFFSEEGCQNGGRSTLQLSLSKGVEARQMYLQVSHIY